MHSKSILVVDDEKIARESLERILTSHGYDVRTAADSPEANAEMAAAPADIVLLDLDLPHIHGDSVAAFLNRRYPKTRIIFMSGQYSTIDTQRFGDSASYLPKPLDIPTLLETIEQDTSHAQVP